MRTAFFSALLVGAGASLAVAEPSMPVVPADAGAKAKADLTRLVPLTDAEMDRLTAGARYAGEGANPFDLIWDIADGTTSRRAVGRGAGSFDAGSLR